jgi:hypothetical protein
MALSSTDRTGTPAPAGWRRLLHQSLDLADFDRRGFAGERGPVRDRLETAARTFLTGYNEALAGPAAVPPDFASQPGDRRGFAVEGAAMQAVLLDVLVPGSRRLPALLDLHGPRYVYLIYVGAGWGMAKLRRPRWHRVRYRDPLLRWLAYDGWGFAQGFFADARRLDRLVRHPGRCTPVCGIRYQGFGRSLWFRECARPDAIAAHIARLPSIHHGDAWSGVGLAAGYACGVTPQVARRLLALAGVAHRADLGQGAAFAAGAWCRSGAVPAAAAPVIGLLTGTGPETAAGWAFATTAGLDGPDATPADYERWRYRIRTRVSAS